MALSGASGGCATEKTPALHPSGRSQERIAQRDWLRESWRGRGVSRELNVLALFKGDERFIFVYDDDSRAALIDDLRQKAADPAVVLNWFDAAVLMERIKNPTPVGDPAVTED